jgi:hypothetical protein
MEYAKLKKSSTTVCPESVLPEASVIVPETMIEYRYCVRLLLLRWQKVCFGI